MEIDPKDCCVDTQHRHAEWPDPEAKVYFVKKIIENPGVTQNRPFKQPRFDKTLQTSDIFKEVLPYEPIDNQKKAKLRESLKNEQRYCLNWACESIFKDSENHQRACKSHPGV